jgi:hypothetical protein
MTLLAAAIDYRRRGWRIVPVPAGEKACNCRSWPDIDLQLDDLPGTFADGGNIALTLGPPSGETVDADLDCPEAVALADLYMPPTAAEFGRASKPRSHRLYIALAGC